MILLIDNYDSFVHNLARYFTLAGWETRIARNDAITLEEIEALQPQAIALSPGPCTPREAGICIPLIQRFAPSIPILGVCLGHQAIGEAFGGQTMRARRPVHGKASLISHTGEGIFSGLPTPLRAGRYHSLISEIPQNSPLAITATSEDGAIMGFAHQDYPTYGVQFHPESILTEHGMEMIENFSLLARAWRPAARRQAA